MTVTANEVKQAFYISRPNIQFTYKQFVNRVIDDVELVLSSSSTTFHIRVFPTASQEITFTDEMGRILGPNRTIIIPPISESIVDNAITIYAKIDSSKFNDTTEEVLNFPISFDLTGLEYVVISPPEPTPTAPNVTPTPTPLPVPTPTPSIPASGPECFPNGNICTEDSDCCSKLCKNPTGEVDRGVCVEYIAPPPPSPSAIPPIGGPPGLPSDQESPERRRSPDEGSGTTPPPSDTYIVPRFTPSSGPSGVGPATNTSTINPNEDSFDVVTGNQPMQEI